jgi:hypothetical protein
MGRGKITHKFYLQSVRGFEITVVGLGGRKEANLLKDEFKLRECLFIVTLGISRINFHFKGTIFLDSKQQLYRALSCRRGMRYALNDQTKGNALHSYQTSLLFGAPVPDDLMYVVLWCTRC